MGVIESLNQTSEKAVDLGETYYRKTREYYKLKIFEQLTQNMGLFCKLLLIGSFVFLGIIFLSVGGTIALSNYLNNTILACLIIGGVLLSFALLCYLFRSKIDTYIITKSSKTFFD